MICCKPVGVLSEDGQAGRCMPELLREHYRSLGQKNPYIATVHRLDKITGGVMAFSRRREVTGKLTAAVQAHEIVKEYLAVLRGHPAEPAATLTDLLFRDAGHNKSYVVKRPREGRPGGQSVLPGAVPDGGAVSGAGAAAYGPHPPDSGAVLLSGGCRCWGTSAMAARTPAVPRPCGPAAWPSAILSQENGWTCFAHRPGSIPGTCSQRWKFEGCYKVL